MMLAYKGYRLKVLFCLTITDITCLSFCNVKNNHENRKKEHQDPSPLYIFYYLKKYLYFVSLLTGVATLD